jgi:hypothetical protein
VSVSDDAFDADLVACVLGNPCGAPPLHPCDIEIWQGHLVHQSDVLAAVLKCVEGGVESLLAATVGFVVGLGGHRADQLVEVAVGDSE